MKPYASFFFQRLDSANPILSGWAIGDQVAGCLGPWGCSFRPLCLERQENATLPVPTGVKTSPFFLPPSVSVCHEPTLHSVHPTGTPHPAAASAESTPPRPSST